MATLLMNQAVMHDWATGTVLVAAPTNGRAWKYDMAGEWVTMAGGRQRFRGQAGDVGAFTVVFLLVSLATVEAVKAARGRVVQVKDHRGQLIRGVFTEVTPIEIKRPTQYRLQVTVRAVTVDEAV